MTWLTGNKYRILDRKVVSAPLDNFKKKVIISLAGLTLLELLIVVIIIGGLLSLSTPRFRTTFNNLRFDSFCQGLTVRMRYLQERSSIEQKIYRLNFDLNNNVIKIEVADDQLKDFTAVKEVLGKSIIIPQGYDIEMEEPSIVFLPDSTIEGSPIKISETNNKATIYIKQSIGKVELIKDD